MSNQEVDVKSGEVTQETNKDEGKKNVSKKLTSLERVAAEGEALLKEMGYKEEGEDQGRRRTRSGGRGLPVSSPPAKKEKKTPSTPGTGRRGRPPKAKAVSKATNDAEVEPEKEENGETESSEAEVKTSPDSDKKEEAKNEPEAKETENNTEDKNSKTPDDAKSSSE